MKTVAKKATKTKKVVKKATKSAKPATTSKAMKKSRRVSKVGRMTSVFSGKKEKTVGGLKKSDLKLNKAGKVVSKKRSEKAKKSKAAGVSLKVITTRKIQLIIIDYGLNFSLVFKITIDNKIINFEIFGRNIMLISF